MIDSFKNRDSLSDSDMLQRYIETGNLEVLGEVYSQYLHLVYGVCLKYLNNRDESKDAVNKIFELLITEIPKFEIKNFRSWLYVVTRNYCMMEIRKNKTEKRRFEKFSEHFFMESTEISHPIDESPGNNLEDQLKKCIEKLKNEQRQCIQLFYYEKKFYKEISVFLEIDELKVKSFIQNGKRNLKICIEENMKKVNA